MSTSLECYNQKSGVQSGEIILPFYHRSNTVFFFFAVALTFTLVAQTDSLNIPGVLEKKGNRYA